MDNQEHSRDERLREMIATAQRQQQLANSMRIYQAAAVHLPDLAMIDTESVRYSAGGNA